jgi:hypothetical protein
MGGLLSPAVTTEGGWRHPPALSPMGELSLSVLRGSVAGSSAVAKKQLESLWSPGEEPESGLLL